MNLTVHIHFYMSVHIACTLVPIIPVCIMCVQEDYMDEHVLVPRTLVKNSTHKPTSNIIQGSCYTMKLTDTLTNKQDTERYRDVFVNRCKQRKGENKSKWSYK